jgi:twitching motility protein PilT
MEMVLEAAETGHAILSSLNSVNTAKAIERIVSAFGVAEQASIRSRLAKTLRYVIAQRLIPRKDQGRVAVREILKVNQHTAQYIESENGAGRNPFQLLGSERGMQSFDVEIENLVRAGTVNLETALAYASDPCELQKTLGVGA